VTKLTLAAELALDVDRIVQHLAAHEVEDIEARLGEIFDALDILVRHPLIGRPAAGGRRDLVIGQGSRGYVARYRYDQIDDEIIVVALRAQRELGFEER
jgi:toxin ParE1/3/4